MNELLRPIGYATEFYGLRAITSDSWRFYYDLKTDAAGPYFRRTIWSIYLMNVSSYELKKRGVYILE